MSFAVFVAAKHLQRIQDFSRQLEVRCTGMGHGTPIETREHASVGAAGRRAPSKLMGLIGNEMASRDTTEQPEKAI